VSNLVLNSIPAFIVAMVVEGTWTLRHPAGAERELGEGAA
jgi:uncharacterized membrane protein SpoIIM required for sporulation